MSPSSLGRLRRFHASVQAVLKTIEANEPFYLQGGERSFEWDDLSYVMSVLKRCRAKTNYRQATAMYMIAASIESTVAVFCGKGVAADIQSVNRHLSYTLNEKTSGQYRYQSDLVFFFGRLRNKLRTRIYLVRRKSKKR